jgi:prepilin-type N-terminal cleavage/methylation domain-containing protein
MRNHRGFTLIEIMIALLIMVVVSGAIFKLLTTNQRLSRAQAANVDLQSNERAAALVVPTELRELNTVIGGTAAQNDILELTDYSIRYRAMRGLGFVCQATQIGTTATEIRLTAWSGYRAPEIPRDAALVFVQTDPSTGTDGNWVLETITAVSTTTCPYPGNPPAITLRVTPQIPSAALVGRIPVRIWEDMQLGLYPQDGKSWLGARSWSAGELGYQPLLGPLLAAEGFRLRAYDKDNALTTVKENVRSIKLTVRGVTSDQVSTSGGSSVMGVVQDSVVSQVTLRNALR